MVVPENTNKIPYLRLLANSAKGWLSLQKQQSPAGVSLPGRGVCLAGFDYLYCR